MDLSESEGVLTSALSLLGSVDLIVVDLFGVHGISEVGKDIEDGIEG